MRLRFTYMSRNSAKSTGTGLHSHFVEASSDSRSLRCKNREDNASLPKVGNVTGAGAGAGTGTRLNVQTALHQFGWGSSVAVSRTGVILGEIDAN